MSYVLTLVASDLANPIEDEDIKHVIRIIGMADVVPTCQAVPLAQNGKAIDLGINERGNREMMDNLKDYLKHKKIDVFITTIEKRRKKLLIADMDSTIINGETLDELAAYANIQDRIAEITTRAMNGELDFHEAVIERVSLLKDLPVQAITDTLNSLETNPGAHTFIKTLRKYNVFCVLVSGGFTVFTGPVAKSLSFNHHHGNNLEVDQEKLTGKIAMPILDSNAKLQLLMRYADNRGLKSEDVMAIGDGANDLAMLKRAGHGMGFQPKPKVAKEIDNLIIHGDLTAALYAQGYTEEEFTKAEQTKI